MMAAIVVILGLALLTIPLRGPKLTAGRTARETQAPTDRSGPGEVVSIQSARTAASKNLMNQSGFESSEKTKELLKVLGEIQPDDLTKEKADRWKQHLEQVIEEGRAAVPVLEEYFDSNENVRFETASGANLLGESTLRIALIKVLFDIPTPDNVALQEKVLQTTTDPEEIALLARQLEQQEPGEHYHSIIQAARRGLQESRNGQLAHHDTASLVSILEGYGIPTK